MSVWSVIGTILFGLAALTVLVIISALNVSDGGLDDESG